MAKKNTKVIKDHDLEFKFSLRKAAIDSEGNIVILKHELDNQEIQSWF